MFWWGFINVFFFKWSVCRQRHVENGKANWLGIPETNFSGRSTRTARSVLRSTVSTLLLAAGEYGNIVTTLKRGKIDFYHSVSILTIKTKMVNQRKPGNFRLRIITTNFGCFGGTTSTTKNARHTYFRPSFGKAQKADPSEINFTFWRFYGSKHLVIK